MLSDYNIPNYAFVEEVNSRPSLLYFTEDDRPFISPNGERHVSSYSSYTVSGCGLYSYFYGLLTHQNFEKREINVEELNDGSCFPFSNIK